MLPATDDIILDGLKLHGVCMRPTLRAASTLERRHGGFDRLIAGITEGNLSIIADVIAEGTATPRKQVLVSIEGQPLGAFIAGAADQLMKFVFALAGVDQTAPKAKAKPTAERITFADYHARLFRIATGWLGWSPEDAWSATAAEINAAYQGRMEMLQAIFGKAEGSDTETDTPDAAQLDRAGLEALRGLGAF